MGRAGVLDWAGMSSFFSGGGAGGSGGKVEAVSVSRLVRRMKNVLEIEVGEVWVEGEVSGLRRQSSGHCYFTLKDERAAVSCVMFAGRARRWGAALEDGAKVRVFGEVSVYEARGQAQLVASKAEAAGLGDLQARFEALKRKLDKEGLFDAGRKRALPAFPRVVGLVTSPTGAALQDMLKVLSRRAPWVEVFVAPVRVQGKGAEAGIARAIEMLGKPEGHGLPRCEVIIAGRGGGSMEDLWCFNEEVVARAIAGCGVPVVSAVGHEIDFTIADFAADRRAATPSAAAELVVPDRGELLLGMKRQGEALRRLALGRVERVEERLRLMKGGVWRRGAGQVLREPVLRVEEARGRLDGAVEGALRGRAEVLRGMGATLRSLHPRVVLRGKEERLGYFRERMRAGAAAALERLEKRLEGQGELLRALGPESAFERGFSITFGADGKVVRDPAQVREGEVVETRVRGGSFRSRVE